MFKNTIYCRVRYAETDRMGYAYYGNYATYFEVARVEALRTLGITYKSLEDEGVLLPVVEYNVRFLLPAYYDDELTIETVISEMPSARIRFEYETKRGDTVLNKAWTILVFVDKQSGRPIRCPHDVADALKKYF
ncbi:MAG: acyl-CoA thioesterase [Flavobacteriales bacterium]